MQIKETADMWALRVKRRLRIPEIKQAAAECSPLIDEQIGRESLSVAGPWLFISHNLPKDGKTEFDWQICRPVIAPISYHGQVELCHLEPIIVAARVYWDRYGCCSRKAMLLSSRRSKCRGMLSPEKAARYAMIGEVGGRTISRSKFNSDFPDKRS